MVRWHTRYLRQSLVSLILVCTYLNSLLVLLFKFSVVVGCSYV